MSENPKLEEVVAVLERTPASLTAMLLGLPEKWTTATEGPQTWSPYDVIGHLIHGERTDWMIRGRHILAARLEPFGCAHVPLGSCYLRNHCVEFQLHSYRD